MIKFLFLLFIFFSYMAAIQPENATGYILLNMLDLLTIIIVVLYRIFHYTKEVVSDTIEFVGDLIEAAVDTFIDLFTVQQEVKQRVPSAFKILIMKKKRNAIDVGIFNKNSKPITKMEIKSDYGISKELVVGQEYIL